MESVKKNLGDNMDNKFEYKIIDYINLDHHNYNRVEIFFNEFTKDYFELVEGVDMGEKNTNKDGKFKV